MKNIFIEELINSTKKNKNICLIVNDLGYGMIEPFAKCFRKYICIREDAYEKHDGLCSCGSCGSAVHLFIP